MVNQPAADAMGAVSGEFARRDLARLQDPARPAVEKPAQVCFTDRTTLCISTPEGWKAIMTTDEPPSAEWLKHAEQLARDTDQKVLVHIEATLIVERLFCPPDKTPP